MQTKKKILIVCMVGALLLLSISVSGKNNSGHNNNHSKATIELLSKKVILGPKINLGDVCDFKNMDTKIVHKLSSIILGIAPPPGESKEITRSFIKRRLIGAGFKNYIDYIEGPKRIQVTTAQNEIDKAFLGEYFI